MSNDGNAAAACSLAVVAALILASRHYTQARLRLFFFPFVVVFAGVSHNKELALVIDPDRPEEHSKCADLSVFTNSIGQVCGFTFIGHPVQLSAIIAGLHSAVDATRHTLAAINSL